MGTVWFPGVTSASLKWKVWLPRLKLGLDAEPVDLSDGLKALGVRLNPIVRR